MIVTKYVTEDEEEFDDIEKARSHEYDLERRKRLIDVDGKKLSKENILEYFEKVKTDGCEICPLRKECDEMYHEMRKHTKDTFSLCDVIFSKYKFY